jgi:hypothetical protein
MAFLKTAKAHVTIPSIDLSDWMRLKPVAFNTRTAAKVITGYDPKDYLFSHCTIISSVDTEDVPNVKLGDVQEDGARIKRKFSNYHITPETSIFINGNGDSWEREVLKQSYQTFVGAENYLEHCQQLSESKGKIIDAVARDLGDTIYIDILVATNRKHADLIEDILSGKMRTLSMGCTCEFTQCSRCGNVAVDETDLCSCIRYMKGQTFVDSTGKERKIAELCGHKSEPKSVTFIEASWVADPAFTGAVVHSILNPGTSGKVAEMLANAYRAESLASATAVKKAASLKVAAPGDDEPVDDEGDPVVDDAGEGDAGEGDTGEGDTGEGDAGGDFDFGGGGGGGGGDDDFEFSDSGFDTFEEEPTSYESLVEQVKDKVFDDVVEKIVDDLGSNKPDFKVPSAIADDFLHESSLKRISRNVTAGLVQYQKMGFKSLTGKLSALEMLLVARKAGIPFSGREIKTILRVGAMNRYKNKEAFLKKVQYLFCTPLSVRERKRFVIGGTLLNLSKDPR